MCMWFCLRADDPAQSFRNSNLFFGVLHSVLVLICLSVLFSRLPLVPYYTLTVLRVQAIKVYPVALACIVNGIAAFIHFIWSLFANSIVHNSIHHYRVNHARWLYHSICDGLCLTLILVLLKADSFDTLLLTFLLWSCIMCLTYFQDSYVSRNQFDPKCAPHTFAFPFYVILMVFIVLYSAQNLHEENIFQLIVSGVALLFTLQIFFIQKTQMVYLLRLRRDSSRIDHSEFDVDENDHESHTEVELSEMNSHANTDTRFIGIDSEKESMTSNLEDTALRLASQIESMRAAVRFEVYFYCASFVSHLLVSLLTLDKVVLLSERFVHDHPPNPY